MELTYRRAIPLDLNQPAGAASVAPLPEGRAAPQPGLRRLRKLAWSRPGMSGFNGTDQTVQGTGCRPGHAGVMLLAASDASGVW